MLSVFRVGCSMSFTDCAGCAGLGRALEQHEDGCIYVLSEFFRLLDFSSLILSFLHNISLIVLISSYLSSHVQLKIEV